MTTREEAVAMMDWLRSVGAIGIGCEDDESGESHLHFPEGCDEEYLDYLTSFEILLRKRYTEHVYYAIRTAARLRWEQLYGEGFDGPYMAARCANPLPTVRFDAVSITGAELEPSPKRRRWWPFGR